jgi:hypothetical protein
MSTVPRTEAARASWAPWTSFFSAIVPMLALEQHMSRRHFDNRLTFHARSTYD